MKKTLILLTLFTSFVATAQSIEINANGATANASAVLDLKSTTKGFLLPRMTNAQMLAIPSPAQGLLAFCTDCSTNGDYYFYKGTAWVALGSTTVSVSTTVGAVSDNADEKGATITNGVLNLAPANATNPGIVTKTAQTIAGVKTFSNGIVGNVTGNVTGNASTATTATSATTATTATNISGGAAGSIPYQTGAGSTSLLAAGSSGQVLTSAGLGTLTWTTPSSAVTHTIGESFGGGIVFYVTTDGLHGLIAETIDSPNAWWFYAQDNISNPNNHSTAGKLFTDWRLPTRYELNLLVNYYGGLAEGVRYWSSTENGQDAYIYFPSGGFFSNKTGNYSARAIRSF
jgi:hypothetical protein